MHVPEVLYFNYKKYVIIPNEAIFLLFVISFQYVSFLGPRSLLFFPSILSIGSFT